MEEKKPNHRSLVALAGAAAALGMPMPDIINAEKSGEAAHCPRCKARQPAKWPYAYCPDQIVVNCYKCKMAFSDSKERMQIFINEFGSKLLCPSCRDEKSAEGIADRRP